MKILCFTWNTQSVKICESLDDNVISLNRKKSGIMSYFQSRYGSCTKADFIPELISNMKREDIDIVCFSFQEDAYPGSYFHSDLLKSLLIKEGYELVKRSKLMGIGKTSLKGIMTGDIVVRGLRTSIYAKSDLAHDMTQYELNLYPGLKPEDECDSYTHSIYRNKGAICMTLHHPLYKSISFINCHFPFSPKRLLEYSESKDEILMQEKLFEQNQFYNDIYRKFILEKNPTYVFWMGDFNYRVSLIPKPEEGLTLSDLKFRPPVNISVNENIEFWKDLYTNHDELYRQMNKKLIYSMSEGIGNQGPLFPPTCKLEKSNIRGYKMGKNKHRYPSWCDRILHKGNINTLMYTSWDYGNLMRQSDHSSVIGIYEIPNIEYPYDSYFL